MGGRRRDSGEMGAGGMKEWEIDADGRNGGEREGRSGDARNGKGVGRDYGCRWRRGEEARVEGRRKNVGRHGYRRQAR